MPSRALVLEKNWRFREVEPGERPDLAAGLLPEVFANDGWMPATVPGCVHSDLMAAGRIDDPFVGTREKAAWWIESHDFVYKTSFLLPADWDAERAKRGTRIELHFEGLDTFAAIFLNGDRIAESANAFQPLTIDITKHARLGENVLVVHFDSTMRRAIELERTQGRRRALGERTRLYVRRPAYLTGWSMAPRLSGCGITGPVTLQMLNRVRLRSIYLPLTHLTSERADFRIETDVEAFASHHAEVTWTIERLDPVGSGSQHRAEIVWESRRTFDLRPGTFRYSEKISLEKPALWWPLGFGAGRRTLYRVRAIVKNDGILLDERETVFGLRTIDLDRTGNGFTLMVNGVPVFIRGSVWTPMSMYPGRADDEATRAALDLAANANINLLRVWGGGNYESEAFYRRCDELGILVWQDFMFASGEYPDAGELWKSMQREAKTQVRRLRNHPSVVLWCGGDSIELFHHRHGLAWEGTSGEAIFDRLLPHVVREYDPARPYWRSSPSGGEQPNTEETGDHHFATAWEEWEGDESATQTLVAKAARARFISEFGLQGMPGEATVALFTQRRERSLNGADFDAHQKDTDGNARLFSSLVARCRPPESFEELVYLSQWVQAQALAQTIDAWRANKPETMGAIVWHFTDCWPGITWSLVDYARRPKLAYWAVRQAFANTSLALLDAEDGVRIVVVNDGASLDVETRLTCLLRSYLLDGTLIDWTERPVELAPGGKCDLGIVAFATLGITDPRQAVLVAELVGGRSIVASRLHAGTPPRNLDLPEPDVTAELDCAIAGQRAVFLVHASNIVRGVEINVDAIPGARVRFDNGFDIWPSRSVWVQVDTPQGATVEQLMTALRYRCLNDAVPGRVVQWRPLPVRQGRGLAENGNVDILIAHARLSSGDSIPKLKV